MKEKNAGIKEDKERWREENKRHEYYSIRLTPHDPSMISTK